MLHSASCGRIQSSCTQPNVKFTSKTMSNYGYSQSRQHSQRKKNWKHTFYRLDKKGKKIFQNFTQYMHFKFIRTRWISDDCQGKNLWIRCKRGLQWHQVFKSFCIDETILWNKMQRLQSCCLGIEINTVHEVEGQKDPNMFAPLRWSEVKFLYYNQEASN